MPGKAPFRGPDESSYELEGVEGTLTLPTLENQASGACLTTKENIYIHKENSLFSFY